MKSSVRYHIEQIDEEVRITLQRPCWIEVTNEGGYSEYPLLHEEDEQNTELAVIVNISVVPHLKRKL